uniref:EGF-like domain-containing protein n=1 Tax=Callorhinchus milii TaxID=7868 RepID=A0A4W3K9D2_CALMI
RNIGGTQFCDTESWYCECLKTHSGDLCQFTACERSPCGHGATCVPKPSGDPVCLCPYGRAGVLCLDGKYVNSQL